MGVLAGTSVAGEAKALTALDEVSAMGKTVYDFCASPPVSADDGREDEDALTATGTHLINGWRAYQQWLRKLKDEMDAPAAAKRNGASG